MATAAESNTNAKKPKKAVKGPGQNSAVRLKTVVRKLPPTLPEDIFWQSVALWVNDNTCTWKTFHAGRLKGVCVPIRRCRSKAKAET
jgi:regulator of nonsense transcripts 3